MCLLCVAGILEVDNSLLAEDFTLPQAYTGSFRKLSLLAEMDHQRQEEKRWSLGWKGRGKRTAWVSLNH